MLTTLPAHDLAALDLDQQVVSVFKHHPHMRLRKICVKTQAGGKVQLTGEVHSYFEKQIAQEALRGLPGLTQVDNHLCVTR